MDRLRSWLLLWTTLMVGLVMSLVWVFWAYIHMTPRFEQLAPGATGTFGDGSRVRVTKLWQTPVIEGQTYRKEPKRASEGLTFVVVQFEVVKAPKDEHCHFTLATGRVKYEYDSDASGSRSLRPWCQDAEPGVPMQGEMIFQVPVSRADEVYGLAIRDWTPLMREYVVRPG